MPTAVTFNPNNYATGRDATRQLQKDLRQQHPIAYWVGEFVGAMTTPMHLAKGENFKQEAFNALTDTINASVGYACRHRHTRVCLILLTEPSFSMVLVPSAQYQQKSRPEGRFF